MITFDRTQVSQSLGCLQNTSKCFRIIFKNNVIYFIGTRFRRELTQLKLRADYESCDPTKLGEWLVEAGRGLSQYTYQMIISGADRRILRYLNDENLKSDCWIFNGIHRLMILESAKSRYLYHILL